MRPARHSPASAARVACKVAGPAAIRVRRGDPARAQKACRAHGENFDRFKPALAGLVREVWR